MNVGQDGQSRAVGLIVPPSNPILEVEIRQLLGERVALHVSRLPVCESEDLGRRNVVYREACLETALRFGSLPLQGILAGCTGSFYGLGPDRDRQTCEAIGARLARPFLSASAAAVALIQRLGFRRVRLELPYPDGVIAEARRYFEAAGLEVIVADSLLATFGVDHPYAIESSQIQRHLQSLRGPADTLVFLSGTGMLSVEAMLETVQRCHVPVLSANVASAHWLLERLAGGGPGSVAMRQLIDRLRGWLMVTDGQEPDALFNPF